MSLNLTLDPAGLAAALRRENVLLRRRGQQDTTIEIVEAVGYPRAENGRYTSILTAQAGHVATAWSRAWVLLVACNDPDGERGGCVHLKQLRVAGVLLKGSAAVAEHLGLVKTTTGKLFEESGQIVLELAA